MTNRAILLEKLHDRFLSFWSNKAVDMEDAEVHHNALVMIVVIG